MFVYMQRGGGTIKVQMYICYLFSAKCAKIMVYYYRAAILNVYALRWIFNR